MAAPLILHATTIAAWRGERWMGVLLEGPSGVGKSDFALRALVSGWRLVADDRTLVWRSQDRLYGRAPAPLHGLIEARALGVRRTLPLAYAELALVIRCEPAAEALERMPDPETATVLGLSLPRLRLCVREGSALAKADLALAAAVRPL